MHNFCIFIHIFFFVFVFLQQVCNLLSFHLKYTVNVLQQKLEEELALKQQTLNLLCIFDGIVSLQRKRQQKQ